MATKGKQPSEVRDFDINLEADDGDFFTSVNSVVIVAVPESDEPTPTLLPGGAGHPASEIGTPPTTLKVWVSGGTHDVKYKVTTIVTTSVGRVLEHDFFVKVRAK